MKRKFVVILIAQAIVMLMFLVYASYQQTLAQNAQRMAEANAELAQKNALVATRLKSELEEAMKTLNDCK